MPTLAQKLGENCHYSILLRKADAAGISSPSDFIRLAVARGCRHYSGIFPEIGVDPGFAVISNEELVALLLLGSNEFDGMAVRCAAQLASRCDPRLLSEMAKRERIGRSLSYIATAGAMHDSTRVEFWTALLKLIGRQTPVADGVLPHWSRFVSQTGVSRKGGEKVQWLHCQ